MGDPLERDAEAVVRDLEDKVVTYDIATKAYCVALDKDTLEIDHVATNKRRQERIKERLEKGVPGKQFLKRLVERRDKGELPKAALDFMKETGDFCAAYRRDLENEREIAETKDLTPIGKSDVKQRLFQLTSYIDVAKDVQGRNILVCSKCGFVYCEAKENFKLYSLVYERDPAEIYQGRLAFDKDWCVFREFYCPGCGTQSEVEATAPGSPVLHNYELEDL